MKIALVSEHASPLAVIGGVDAGGQNIHVAALARELAARGHEVRVYTRRDAAHLPDRVELCPRVIVEHITAGPAAPISKDVLFRWMDDLADGLRRAWRRWRPDVVHSHFWMSAYAALRARAEVGVPVAHTFHALGSVRRRHQGAADKSPSNRVAVEAMIANEVDWLICTSGDEVMELRAIAALHDRLSIVPCGVDPSLFRPDGASWPRPAAGRHRVVVVSRLVPRKGVDDVIRAMVEVPEAELLIAGGPDYAALTCDDEGARLLALIEELSLEDRVSMLGRIAPTSVPALLRSADVAVTVPWYEPFGISAVEAMACGVPLVASGVGGLLDTVEHGVTGLHVPPRSPPSVAEAVRTLLADPSRRARYGEAGAARVQARYGWPQVAGATLDAYHRMLRRSASAQLGEAR